MALLLGLFRYEISVMITHIGRDVKGSAVLVELANSEARSREIRREKTLLNHVIRAK